MDVGDKNGQNRHQRLIVVTDTFRLQHRFLNSNLESKTKQNPDIALMTNLCLDSVNFRPSKLQLRVFRRNFSVNFLEFGLLKYRM